MPLPEAVKRIAECAPGKRVTVILASGKAFELPLTPEPAPVEAPHPLEAVSKQLLERDAETRAQFAEVVGVVARVDDAMNAVKDAVGLVAQGHAQVAQSINEMASTMAQPVRPVYDKSGKLIGTQRVKTLGA